MKVLFTLFFLGCFWNVQAQEQEPTIWSRVKIPFETNRVLQISQLGIPPDYRFQGAQKDLIFDLSNHEIELLVEHGIPYEIEIKDVKAWYRKQNATATGLTTPFRNSGICGPNVLDKYSTPANYQYGSMGGYHTYDELMATLDSMAAKFPNLITIRQPIGSFQTQEGRSIFVLKVSDNPYVDENEPQLLYTALHHAREPNSLSQMLFYLWYLLENYATNSEVKYLVDHTEMYFVPCVNPDGYIYNQTTDPNGGGLWRKNRRSTSGNVHGVDLNRNYGYQWGYDNFGSSGDIQSITYRGAAAFSEPEVQAIASLCNTKQFKICLNYHTYGNLLAMPWGYNDQPTEDNDLYLAFGAILTKENNYTAGLASQTFGYAVNGDANDWMYGDSVIKPQIIAFTPEVGDRFWPSQNEIDPLNKGCMAQNLNAAHLVLNYGELKEKNAKPFITNNASLNFSLTKYGFLNGPLTVSITCPHPDITIQNGLKTFYLNQLEDTTLLVNLSIGNTILSGTAVDLIYEVDNGQHIFSNSVTKTYHSGTTSTVFQEDGTSLNNWEQLSAWNTTSATFVSSPSSITDSPNGNYQGNLDNELLLKTPINLSNAVSASLHFEAKWEIEKEYDFAQILASSDGVTFTALCGNYTFPGSVYQALDEPVYHGNQYNWISEDIDISDYVGGQLWIKFKMKSDANLQKDGFYFDNLSVEKLELNPLNIDLFKANNILHVSPNPFDQSIQVDLSLSNPLRGANLRITNYLGQLIVNQKLGNLTSGAHKFIVDSQQLPNGTYFVQLFSDNHLLISKKLLKLK